MYLPTYEGTLPIYTRKWKITKEEFIKGVHFGTLFEHSVKLNNTKQTDWNYIIGIMNWFCTYENFFSVFHEND